MYCTNKKIKYLSIYIFLKNVLHFSLQVFRCLPTDAVETFQALHEYQKKTPMSQTDPVQARQLLQKVQGHLVLMPLQFLRGENLQPTINTKEGLAPTIIWTWVYDYIIMSVTICKWPYTWNVQHQWSLISWYSHNRIFASEQLPVDVIIDLLYMLPGMSCMWYALYDVIDHIDNSGFSTRTLIVVAHHVWICSTMYEFWGRMFKY